eukprot:gene10546-12197_t
MSFTKPTKRPTYILAPPALAACGHQHLSLIWSMMTSAQAHSIRTTAPRAPPMIRSSLPGLAKPSNTRSIPSFTTSALFQTSHPNRGTATALQQPSHTLLLPSSFVITAPAHFNRQSLSHDIARVFVYKCQESVLYNTAHGRKLEGDYEGLLRALRDSNPQAAHTIEPGYTNFRPKSTDVSEFLSVAPWTGKLSDEDSFPVNTTLQPECTDSTKDSRPAYTTLLRESTDILEKPLSVTPRTSELSDGSEDSILVNTTLQPECTDLTKDSRPVYTTLLRESTDILEKPLSVTPRTSELSDGSEDSLPANTALPSECTDLTEDSRPAYTTLQLESTDLLEKPLSATPQTNELSGGTEESLPGTRNRDWRLHNYDYKTICAQLLDADLGVSVESETQMCEYLFRIRF